MAFLFIDGREHFLKKILSGEVSFQGFLSKTRL